MASTSVINTKFATNRVKAHYAHVGLYDVADLQLWVARKRFGQRVDQVSHARLITGGTNSTSTADKDRFMCYWFHTPNTGSGPVQGYPIEWEEGHLLIRLDPNWDYHKQAFISNTSERKLEKNIDQQFAAGKRIYQSYLDLKPGFPLSYHMIGPRAADSIFYVERHEAFEALR